MDIPLCGLRAHFELVPNQSLRKLAQSIASQLREYPRLQRSGLPLTLRVHNRAPDAGMLRAFLGREAAKKRAAGGSVGEVAATMGLPFVAYAGARQSGVDFIGALGWGVAWVVPAFAVAILLDHRTNKRIAARHAGRHWSGLTRPWHPHSRPLVRSFKRARG